MKGLEEGKVTKNSNCNKQPELGLKDNVSQQQSRALCQRGSCFLESAAVKDPEVYTPHPQLLLPLAIANAAFGIVVATVTS